MDLKKRLESYIAVSNKAGLFELVNTRNNGLVLKDMDTGKTKFVSIRQHQFTPLATVAIYTMEDTEELSKVFQNMLDQQGDNPPPAANSEPAVIFDYFEDVLPTFDKDMVKLSDIKKVIKWFYFLQEHHVFVAGNDDEEE